MSRVSILKRLMSKDKKSALEFHYEKLTAPPINALFTPEDINELIRIATSLRYNGNIEKKYECIDKVMRHRGFIKAHCGTNRVVYNYLEDPSFVVKVALDKVGMTDSPREFKNQAFFQPFCCKVFEVHPSGILATVERVNPISSLEEFMSVANDVFNLMVIKILGRYVVDDLGTKTFMNFGVRDDAMGSVFGPVVIDFPYVYEPDGAKLFCRHVLPNGEICNGEIDYKTGFNGLYCTRCFREYKAMDLAKDQVPVELIWDQWDSEPIKHLLHRLRARIVDGRVTLFDSGRQSKLYVAKEDFVMVGDYDDSPSTVRVMRSVRIKNPTREELRSEANAGLREKIRQAQAEALRPKIKDLFVNPDVPSTSVRVKKVVVGPEYQDRTTNPALTDVDEYYITEGPTISKVGRSVRSLDFVFDDDDEFVIIGQEENPEEPTVVSSECQTGVFSDKIRQEFTFQGISISEVKKPIATPVSEDEVKKMIAGVEKRMAPVEDNSSGDDAILDSEGDKKMVNPMTRPYANGDPSTFVGNRQPRVETKTFEDIFVDPSVSITPPKQPKSRGLVSLAEIFEDQMKKSPVSQPNLVHDPETDKGQGQTRYQNKKKRRDNGGYDDEEGEE